MLSSNPAVASPPSKYKTGRHCYNSGGGTHNQPNNHNTPAINLSHCASILDSDFNNILAAMKNTVNWRSFFTFFVAPSLFLLAGPASPLLAIILFFSALVGAKFYRRITQSSSATHYRLESGNPSQREKADRLSGQQLENRSESIRNKISDARKRLTATS